MRLRSRQAETQDVNQRRLGRRAVSRTAVQPRAIGALEELPGFRRPLAPKDFGAEAIGELDGRYQDPWAISVTTGVQEFAEAGTLAEWTGVKPGPVTVGFDLSFPTDVLTIVQPGTYRLDVDHRWADYLGGGTVEVLVNGTVIWGPDSEPYGPSFATTYNLGLLDRGDEVQVRVAPTDGTEDGVTVGSLVLVEPAAQKAPLPPPEFGEVLGPVTTSGTSFNSSHTLSVSAPEGTEVGDLLVVSWLGRSLFGFGGGSGTMTPDGNFTLAAWHTESGTLFQDRQQHYLYAKAADSADAAGTATYEWATTGSENNRSSLAMIAVKGAGGLGLGASAAEGQSGELASLSLPSLSGGLVLVAAAGRRNQNSPNTFSTPTLVAPTETVAAYTAGTPSRGVHRIGVAPDGTAVEATFTGTDERSYQFLLGVVLE